MQKNLFAAILPASFFLALLASQPVRAGDEASSRFQIEKTKYGFVRLDGQTGAMTFCREEDDILTCIPANSETSAVENQLRALEEKVSRLEIALKTEEDRARASEDKLKAALSEAAKSPPAFGKLPSDAEIDETFSFFEKIMRKFMDMTRELDQDGALPQRS